MYLPDDFQLIINLNMKFNEVEYGHTVYSKMKRYT